MGDMTQKTLTIDKYIHRLDDIITTSNGSNARQLIKEIVAVYESEIKDIRSQLEMYSIIYSDNPNFINDATILKAKLLNYKQNLVSGLYEHLGKSGKGLQITQKVNQNLTSNVEITLDNTVSLINNLPNETLSDDDKDVLNGKLAAISAASDKLTRWEKAKSALKWIAEKGIEVGTAALPYIVEALKK